jgi:hypothetical protein
MIQTRHPIVGALVVAGAVLALPAAAQDAAAVAETAGEAAATVAAEADVSAEARGSADATAVTNATVTEAEVDSFAQATVKLKAIHDDAAIGPDQKQSAMAEVVTSVGLNPAKYNAIGKAAQADAALMARLQTALAKHASPRTDG